MFKLIKEEDYDQLKPGLEYSYNCKSCGLEISTKKADGRKPQLSQKTFICGKCKRKKTFLEKYGVDNPMKDEKLREKSKQTCFEKYGVDNPMKVEDFKESQKQTCFERYGEDYNLVLKNKRQATCLERYGSFNFVETEDFQEKSKKTCLERYGVEHFSQTLTFLDKIKQTNIERYGVEFANQSKEILDRQKESCRRSLGVDYPALSSFVRGKIKKAWEQKTSEEKLELRRKSNKHNFYKSQDGEVFDSLWELKYYEYCKSKNYNIIREPVGLEYEYEGIKHNYYPDFSVNGRLVEIKGDYLKDNSGKWCCPFKCQEQSYLNGLYEAKRQCAIRNNVQILYQKDLEELGLDI